MAHDSVTIIQWLVDTRHLWPEATKTKQLEAAAPRALALLTDDERAGVMKYYFAKDAKMSLVSHLLKHFVISKYCNVPWSQTTLSRDENRKPIYRDAAGKQPIHFNVTHQAGIVGLAAVQGYGGPGRRVEVGTDIVCISERHERDLDMIRDKGWAQFVDVHADVFAPSAVSYLKSSAISSLPGPGPLRHFYALWCLTEAYVKMTGEALLAPWLRDLDFGAFRAPLPAPVYKQAVGDEGETINSHDITFEGEKVDDANICLRSLGPDYMTCTAIRTPAKKEDGLSWELGPYEFMDINTILDHAEAAQD